MALTQRLEFRQSQSLVMTPQLMQAIKLLQLSNLEVTAYVDSELEQNPLLEREEGADAMMNREFPHLPCAVEPPLGGASRSSPRPRVTEVFMYAMQVRSPRGTSSPGTGSTGIHALTPRPSTL